MSGKVAVGEAEGGEVKLTSKQKEEALVLRRSGHTLKYIAQQFNCSVEGVRQACRRTEWKKELENNTNRALRCRIPPNRIRIDQITMSTRAFSTLCKLDVIYLSEVSRFTEREILSIKGASRKTLIEIRDQILQPFGLTLEYND